MYRYWSGFNRYNEISVSVIGIIGDREYEPGKLTGEYETRHKDREIGTMHSDSGIETRQSDRGI